MWLQIVVLSLLLEKCYFSDACTARNKPISIVESRITISDIIRASSRSPLSKYVDTNDTIVRAIESRSFALLSPCTHLLRRCIELSGRRAARLVVASGQAGGSNLVLIHKTCGTALPLPLRRSLTYRRVDGISRWIDGEGTDGLYTALFSSKFLCDGA